jgi:hypothetical protein
MTVVSHTISPQRFLTYMMLLMLIGEDVEAGILSQPTGKFPKDARQPRLIVLATGKK